MLLKLNEYNYYLMIVFTFIKLHNYADLSYTCSLLRQICKNKQFKRCINYILYMKDNELVFNTRLLKKLNEQFPNIIIKSYDDDTEQSPKLYCIRENCFKYIEEAYNNHLCHMCDKYYKLCPVNNCFRIIKNKKNMCIYHYRSLQPSGINFKSYYKSKYRSTIHKCFIQNNLDSYEDVHQYCIDNYIENVDYNNWII